MDRNNDRVLTIGFWSEHLRRHLRVDLYANSLPVRMV